MSEYAAAIGDFIDSMRLRNIAVLGLRGGAVPATELALMRPAQLSRVILISVPLLSESERQATRSQTPAATSDAPRWVLEAAAQYPLRERLARVSQRLLVLRPRDDLWEATGRVREVLAATRLLELPQGGLEALAQAPQRIAEASREFLRG
jgi:pimeloyl-ACP methyl ester carboxylesterase